MKWHGIVAILSIIFVFMADVPLVCSKAGGADIKKFQFSKDNPPSAEIIK